MKKCWFLILFLTLSILLGRSVPAYADTTYEDGGFTFSPISNTGNATITGYTGTASALAIPSCVTDSDGVSYTVTALGGDAWPIMRNCWQLPYPIP